MRTALSDSVHGWVCDDRTASLLPILSWQINSLSETFHNIHVYKFSDVVLFIVQHCGETQKSRKFRELSPVLATPMPEWMALWWAGNLNIGDSNIWRNNWKGISWLVGWLSGRTSVSDRRTFTGLHCTGPAADG